tara:strand:- start:227 stop:616 length:390 start_codon:yes stop_codon:yes gene_type:complete
MCPQGLQNRKANRMIYQALLSCGNLTEELAMTKSELIEKIVSRQPQLSPRDVELAVKTMLDHMSQTLSEGERIEIRGFGSFSLHYRAPRMGRNPKTGETVDLKGKYVPHFKPGKDLRDQVNVGVSDTDY